MEGGRGGRSAGGAWARALAWRQTATAALPYYKERVQAGRRGQGGAGASGAANNLCVARLERVLRRLPVFQIEARADGVKHVFCRERARARQLRVARAHLLERRRLSLERGPAAAERVAGAPGSVGEPLVVGQHERVDGEARELAAREREARVERAADREERLALTRARRARGRAGGGRSRAPPPERGRAPDGRGRRGRLVERTREVIDGGERHRPGQHARRTGDGDGEWPARPSAFRAKNATGRPRWKPQTAGRTSGARRA